MAKKNLTINDVDLKYGTSKKSNDKSKEIVIRNNIQIQKAQTNALLNLATFSNPNPKRIGPFHGHHRIFVVGDGDFSFSLALAITLGGNKIVATCYDSKQELIEKYPTALANVDALDTAGAKVYFNVDATACEKLKWIHQEDPFHSIVFNFPHLGGATEEDIVKNQQLLVGFFSSIRQFLHPSQGQALVSLRNTPFYNRWEVEEQAKRCGFQLKRKERFDPSMYSGYQPQRTHPASFRGEPPSTIGAFYYIFSIDPSFQNLTNQQAKLKQLTGLKATKTDEKTLKTTVLQKSLECKICGGIKFIDVKRYNGHLNSAKHARRVKKSRQQK